MVTGVTEGYTKPLEIVGVGYRVQRAVLDLQFALRVQPSRSRDAAGWDHVRGQDRPGSRSAASTSNWARPRPRSPSCASPTRTRARACVTKASTSAARSERLGSRHGAHANEACPGQGGGPIAPSHPGPEEGRRLGWTAASRRDPVQPARVRAGRRRRRRAHAGVGVHHGGRAAIQHLGQDCEEARVGRLVATRAKDAGVDTVVFDRAGNRYHGRVAALAEERPRRWARLLMTARTTTSPQLMNDTRK